MAILLLFTLISVLHIGICSKLIAPKVINIERSKKNLCAFFLRDCSTFQHLISSSVILTLNGHCEFSVVVKRCTPGYFKQLLSFFEPLNATLALYRCMNTLEHGQLAGPMMLERLMTVVRYYDYIWSIPVESQPNTTRMSRQIKCGPLLSPVFSFTNPATLNTTIHTAAPDWLLFNTSFFEWCVKNVLMPMAVTDGKTAMSSFNFTTVVLRASVAFATANKISSTPLEPEFGLFRNISAINGINMYVDETQIGHCSGMDKVHSTDAYANSTQHLLKHDEMENLLRNNNDDYDFSKADDLGLIPNRDQQLVPVSRVYALYFPQFHRDELNDRLWGAGFSDWDNLFAAPTVNRNGDAVIAPAPHELGYYDLLETHTRRRQGRLARRYGIDGFIYHHYWFYEGEGSRRNGSGATLAGPLEAMLLDGEPNITFALHWCNEDWTITWHGGIAQSTVVEVNTGVVNATGNTMRRRERRGRRRGDVLQQQSYPHPGDPRVRQHFVFLRRFFEHPNYIRINGVPLFMVYRPGVEEAWPIIAQFREWMMQEGFPAPGLHIPWVGNINTVNVTATPKVASPATLEHLLHSTQGYFHYPTFMPPKPPMCTEHAANHHLYQQPVYLGTYTTFDNTPRRSFYHADIWNRSLTRGGASVQHLSKACVPKTPSELFESDLVELMLFDMCCQSASVRASGGQFVVVNAWNEWGEGMALEPSDVHGRAFLEAVLRAKRVVKNWKCELRRYRVIRGVCRQ